MKTYCKHDLLHNREFCFRMVLQAFRRKWKRRNYQKALAHYCSISLNQVKKAVLENRQEDLHYGLYAIVDEFQAELSDKKFNLSPIQYKPRVDGLSGKTRNIGIMSVKQQCYEHIAVGALGDLFQAKISRHQYASMKKRGQVAGMKKIRKWIRDDNWSAECAKKYGSRYDRKCTQHVKLDISQCFPSITLAVVMRFLRHDISKNEELLFCVEELLNTHAAGGQGLVIGSLLSQFLCNFLLSYVYRELMNYHKIRRGKRVKLVSHALFYMDDLLLVGKDRRDLKMATRKIINYARIELGLTIKKNWHIKEWAKEPVDMMGFAVYGDGHVVIRPRIFLLARRSFLRAAHRTMTLQYARRLMAYFGYFKHTNSHDVQKKLEVTKIKRIAIRIIKKHDRKECKRYAVFNPVHRRTCPC